MKKLFYTVLRQEKIKRRRSAGGSGKHRNENWHGRREVALWCRIQYIEKDQQHYNIRNMQKAITLVHTQKKNQPSTHSSYKSMTMLKDKIETVQLNEQTISPCTCKKLCGVSITPEAVRDSILELLSQSNSPATLALLNFINTWIGNQWKEHRMKIANRITKLKYLHPSLISESYPTIEKEIVIEWKKNSFLHGCQLLWNHVFRTHKFGDLGALQQFYQIIKNLIAQVTFVLFEPCLRALSHKKYPVEYKIINFTAVSLITSHKEWKHVADRLIRPFLLRNAVSFSENFSLGELKAPPQIVDLSNSQPLYPQTGKSLSRLVEASSLAQLVANLNQYRSNLLMEIKANIDLWSLKQKKSCGLILEKDDILSCLIYILVTYKIDDLGVALSYLKFLLGEEVDNVLREFKVDCYRADLEGVYEYLTMPVARVQFMQNQEGLSFEQKQLVRA